MRKFVCAAVVLAFCGGFVFAEEISAIIIKVEGDKVTFKGKDSPEKTLPVDAKVKVVKGKFNKETKKVEAGDELKDGLKNEMFSKIGEKGLRATVVTDSDNKKITEIRVFGGRKKDNP